MITSLDLRAPAGEIEEEFFPEEDSFAVVDRLSAYLAEGYLKAAALAVGAVQDSAAAAWAYHRAYRAIYTRLSAAPSSVTNSDQGSASYTGAQIKSFADLAAEKLSSFNGQVSVAVVPPPPALASGSTSHVFSW